MHGRRAQAALEPLAVRLPLEGSLEARQQAGMCPFKLQRLDTKFGAESATLLDISKKLSKLL